MMAVNRMSADLDELLVYELGVAGARVIAVNIDSRAVRVVREAGGTSRIEVVA